MASRNFDALVQQSSDLVAEVDASGFSLPRVERNVEQLAEAARQLKAKTPRIDAPGDTNAATRLLAREGFNEDRLRRDLRSFELKTTYDDVFPVEATAVDDYLRQVHEMSVLAAISEAQRDTLVGFEDYMADCAEADWAQEKRLLLYKCGRGLAPSSAPSPAAPSSATPAASPAPSGYIGAPGTPLTPRTPFGGGGPSVSASAYFPGNPRAEAYAAAVKEINTASVRGAAINAVDTLGNAALRGGASPVVQCWRVLSSVVKESGGGGAGADAPPPATRRLLRGALRHLEEGYEQYMLDVIRRHPTRAALGGGAGRLQRVRAFMRVQPRRRPEDEGADTTWQQIYHCLRAGFYAEALEVAESSRELANAAARLVGGSFAGHLRAWVESDGELSPQARQAISGECERILREPERGAAQDHRLLVLAALCGASRVADRLQQECPMFFSTIEDFMWFLLTRVLPTADYPPASEGMMSPGSPGGGLGGGDAAGAYTLETMQKYLNQYPPSHYSKGGREPLQYVAVLLLSLQFRAAYSFLASEARAEEFHSDAVHLAIAMHHHGLLAAPAAESPHVQGGVDAARLVHNYGRQFVAEDPQLALEYYMRCAAVGGEGLQAEARLLRELLCESRPGRNRVLLGSLGGGEGGALARFVPERAARARLLDAAAHECEQAAQYDEAVELYRHAGRMAPALAIINRKLSDALGEARGGAAPMASPLGGGAGGAPDRAAELLARGEALEEDARAAGGGGESGGDDARREVEALEQLRRVRQLLLHHRAGRHADVLRVLAQLPFIPLEAFRVDKCVADIDGLHPAVAMRLPDILVAAAESIRDAFVRAADAARRAPGSTGDIGESARRLREQLGAVTALAGSAKFRVPPQVYQQLARIAASL